MRWPWQPKNPHCWELIGVGGGFYNGENSRDVWCEYRCLRCSETHVDNGYWTPKLPPPNGCVAIPAPAVSAPNDAASLPIPSCPHTIWMGADAEGYECLKCGERD